ncbi:MAG: LicD family protein [Prevotella sp.]|nr:LicD family protein [Prevotella sp.]
MKKLDLSDCHSVLLDIAKSFHRLCRDNDIPYYMLGGTMLGAIRHKGFIPWDDDMDFGIPREHFSRFIRLAQKEFPPYYQVLFLENSDYALTGFAKISDSRTLIKEQFSVRTSENIGVNVDVFPLDDSDANWSFGSFNMCVRSMFKFQKLLIVNSKDRPFFKRILSRLVQLLVPISKRSIPVFLERMIVRRPVKDREMWSNFFGAWGAKETVPKRVFGKPTLYQFEDTMFFGAENYDRYLSTLYGDYMTPPDPSCIHVHQSSAYSVSQ